MPVGIPLLMVNEIKGKSLQVTSREGVYKVILFVSGSYPIFVGYTTHLLKFTRFLHLSGSEKVKCFSRFRHTELKPRNFKLKTKFRKEQDHESKIKC
jgi:hypothetical protein